MSCFRIPVSAHQVHAAAPEKRAGGVHQSQTSTADGAQVGCYASGIYVVIVDDVSGLHPQSSGWPAGESRNANKKTKITKKSHDRRRTNETP